MGISQEDFNRLLGKFEKMADDRRSESAATIDRIQSEQRLQQTTAQANTAVTQAAAIAAAARLAEENARHAVDVDEQDLRHEFDTLVVDPEPTPTPTPEPQL